MFVCSFFPSPAVSALPSKILLPNGQKMDPWLYAHFCEQTGVAAAAAGQRGEACNVATLHCRPGMCAFTHLRMQGALVPKLSLVQQSCIAQFVLQSLRSKTHPIGCGSRFCAIVCKL